METQLSMFVENTATGEVREGAILPLTNALMDAVFGADDDDSYVETDHSFEDMMEFARNYGRELARTGVSSNINARVMGFVDGMAATNTLTSGQRDLLRQACFGTARPWAADS